LGNPLNPCRIVRYNLVQEQGTTNWSATSVGRSIIMADWNAIPCPIATFRFTTFSSLAAGAEHLDHQYTGFPDASQMFLRNCQVQGGKLTSLAAGLFLTNCLLERVDLACYGATSRVQNCTFSGGWWSVDGTVGDHRAFDNLFDKTAIDDLAFGVTNNFNGYVTTNYGRLVPNGLNDRILTNQAYQAASLGRFYVESTSPLIDQGSTYATNIGLYHFTTLTNQTKEGTSTNDIGFHYIALNGAGVPVDGDGDGLADYLEDADGDGIADASETSWQTYNSPNGIGTGPGLVIFTPLK